MRFKAEQHRCSQNACQSKQFLKNTDLKFNSTLKAEIGDTQIVLNPSFSHRDLRERAAAYGSQLNLSYEMERENPVGSEIW